MCVYKTDLAKDFDKDLFLYLSDALTVAWF